MLKAGYKANVIPSVAEAVVDCRVVPGRQEAFLREVDDLLGPDVTREWVTDLPPVETEFEGPLTDAMVAALQAQDDGATAIPYMLSGGTDAKSFAHAGDALLRLRAAAPAARPGLRFAFPWDRRARSGRRADLRYPGSRHLL